VVAEPAVFRLNRSDRAVGGRRRRPVPASQPPGPDSASALSRPTARRAPACPPRPLRVAGL